MASEDAKQGMHGKRTTRRKSSAQAAVPSTTLTGAAGANPTQAEYATVVTRLNAVTVLVNELRTSLVEKGIIKGSA